MELPKEPAEGQPLSYTWGVQMVRCMRAIWPQSSPTCRVNVGTNGTTFSPRQAGGSSGSDFDFSKLCLGFAIAGATVTIIGGEVNWGTNEPIEVVDTQVNLTADYQYVGIEFDGAELRVIGPSTIKATFRRDATVYRKWLYQFRLVEGMASLLRAGGLAGNIEIPGWFAPGG